MKYYLFFLSLLIFSVCKPTEFKQDWPENLVKLCGYPPVSEFKSVGLDLDFEKSTFGEVVTGDVSLESKPQVISLASKAVADDKVRSFLTCLAIKRDGFTREQAAYLTEMNSFLSTKPSSQEFLQWKKTNPFPSENSKILRKKEAKSEQTISCIGGSGDVGDARISRIRVSIPKESKINNVRAYMKNATWTSGGVPCRSALETTSYFECNIDKGDCPVGWSRVTDLQISESGSEKIVSAKFWNWRHDNERTGKLIVEYEIFN